MVVILSILVLNACSQATPSEAPVADTSGGEMEHTMDSMGSSDAPFDAQFIDSMIEHHEGAIDMANNVLSVGKDPEVKKLAEAIVAGQQAEIVEMTEMLGR